MNLHTHQKGLTLIEVMISVTIGLLFLTAAMGYLVTSQQSFRAQDTGTRIQENARFAMDILRRNVRMAGHSDDLAIAPAYIYREACGNDPCADDTATAQGDRLAVAMVSPDAEDCLGNDLGTETHVANVFWVEVVGDMSSLYCRGWDVENGGWHSASQPLVDGVDQMQVQYGVYNSATDSIDRYLNAAGVEALANGWDNVRSVRIALLVQSGQDTDEADTSGNTVGNATFAANYTTFTLLDGAAYTPGDQRIRRVFTNTVAINNAL
ncbi:MAG: PilW family protein [Pseudomonadales bacterium]